MRGLPCRALAPGPLPTQDHKNLTPCPRRALNPAPCPHRPLNPAPLSAQDPKRRATADQVLMHPWMKENGVASDKALEMEVLTRIRKFSAGNRLKKEAVKIIACNLPSDEISGMREMFMEIDKDKSGSITVEEFANALRRKGNQLPEAEVQRIVNVSLDDAMSAVSSLTCIFLLLYRMLTLMVMAPLIMKSSLLPP